MSKHNTPADQGTQAAIKDARLASETRFIENRLGDFKDFVIDSMTQDIHHDFEDDLEFLKACMNVWVNMEQSDD